MEILCKKTGGGVGGAVLKTGVKGGLLGEGVSGHSNNILKA